jgi:hypothetical protein
MKKPNTNQRHDDNLEAHILQYLKEHPYAVDTVNGICNWWLKGNASTSEVKAALEYLIRKGSIVAQVTSDGTVLYKRGNNL